MIFLEIALKNIFRILIFTIFYYFITNENFLKIGLIFAIAFVLLKFLDYFQRLNCSFQYLLVVSFLLLLPLTLPLQIQSIYLPFGYQYIYISLISSLIYIDSKKLNLKTSFREILSGSFIASLAPVSYLSGPSATYKEIMNLDKRFFGLPIFEKLQFSNVRLAVSGGLRISLGFYLNTLNPHLLNKEFLLTENSIIYKLCFLILFGFFNFWRYYLLFSGASDLTKSFLSLFDIRVIDNFKNPEIAIFYHEIWSKWHLNITQRIREFLYTPLTLYILRNFKLVNKQIKFLILEGLPVAVLFAVLGLWHGGKSSDLLFAGLSTFFTLSSRALSQNDFFNKKFVHFFIGKEFIRFLSLSLFGLVLGIYDFRNQLINLDSNTKSLFLPLIISIFVYIFYRLKIIFFELNENNGKIKNLDILFCLGEIIAIIYINLFLVLDLEQVNEFIYFAR